MDVHASLAVYRRLAIPCRMSVSGFPIEPPIEPMLAKLADRASRRQRLAVRAEVGRFPRHRVSWRRATYSFRAAICGRSIVIFPNCTRRSCGRCRPAAWWTARSSSRRRTASTSISCSSGSIRRHPASRSSPWQRRRPSWPSMRSPRRRAISARRSAGAARRARATARQGRSRRFISRRSPRDRARAAEWLSRFEGAGLDGVMAKPVDGVVPARQARDGQGEARAHRRLRRRRLPLAQERRSTSSLARCSLVSTTPTAACTMSASRRRSRWTSAVSWPRSLHRYARTRSITIPGASGPPPMARPAPRECPAGRAGGAPARICPGSRCASSACAR